MNESYRQAVVCLFEPLRTVLLRHEADLADKICEARLRLSRPVCLHTPTERLYITQGGNLTRFYSDSLLTTTHEQLDGVVQRVCEYSVYNRQHEILGGYVTLRGGHRAGLCGTAVTDGKTITNLRDLSSLNLRFAREIKGCATALLRRIQPTNGVLLCGEPGSGKTTLLRDLARQLSAQYRVSLIDERGELAASVGGIPQNDVGLCDVYGGYPKALAMECAIRSMSPEIIICDEVSTADVSSLLQCVHCGAAVIATAHARTSEELRRKPVFRRLVQTGAFGSLVFLDDRRRVGQIRDVKSAGEAIAA